MHFLKIITLVTPILGSLAALSIAPLFIVYLLISGLYNRKYDFTYLKSQQNIVIIILLFLLLCFVGSINSYNYIFSLQEAMKLAVIIFSGFYLVNCASNHKVSTYKWLELGYYLALSLCVIEYFLEGYIYNCLHGFRFNDNAAFLANLNRGMCFLAIMSWVIFACQDGYKKYLTFLLSLVVILVYDSESAKLGIIVGVISYALAYLLRKKFIYLFQIGCILICMLIPFFIYNLIYNTDLYFIRKYLPWSFDHRLYIWQNILDLISLKPLFGYGLGASRILSKLEIVNIMIGNESISLLPIHPHNGVLQITLELGVVGLVLYLSFWLTIAYIISKSKVYTDNMKAVIYSIIATYLTISQSSFDIFISWWICLIFIVFYQFRINIHSKDKVAKLG